MGFSDNSYLVGCVPVSVDLSKSGKSQYLNLTKPPYTEVVTVTGSTKTDTIMGNAESNFINAGPGSNVIKGGEGEDTYMVKLKDGCDHIDNYAKDELQDKLFIPINYTDIKITASSEAKGTQKDESVSVNRMDLKISIKVEKEREKSDEGKVLVVLSNLLQNWAKYWKRWAKIFNRS